MLVVNATDELLKHMESKNRSKETLRGYGMDLTMVDRFLSGKYNCPVYVDDITENDIEAYLIMLQTEKNYAAASVNRHLNSIRSLCQFAYKKGWVKVDVSKDIESLKREQKERTYLMEDELQQLLSEMSHRLIQLAARTMALSGLRVSECVNLKLEEVDLKNDLIYVIEGKGNKDRTVPIAQSLKPHLVDYLENWRPVMASNRFFATQKTGELSPQYINRVLHETTEKLGWKKKVTCHILRHSFASNLVSKDVNIVKISKLLGHADLKTTSIYTHSSHKELSEAVDLLS